MLTYDDDVNDDDVFVLMSCIIGRVRIYDFGLLMML